MNTLQQIFAHKKKELEETKERLPMTAMLRSLSVNPPKFLAALKKPGPVIVAEFKRASPSAGVISANGNVEKIAGDYASAGAAALSVLTEKQFFGGSEADLKAAKKIAKLPVLRKDFIFDQYQILEAKSWGADAVLLIAAMLADAKLSILLQACRKWELEAVVEVHTKSELERALAFGADIVGVNNRDLKTMRVDVKTSFELAEWMDGHTTFISESGMESPQTAAELYQAGYKGFLIGTHFMRQPDPGKELKKFLLELKKLAHVKN
ncbi:MAG TPA: indole-3-glycerol phosphate synthase TrpC [candidate division Zixibacteria bacterium]|nr:indole-3-glycerol phosphate synthase TrpC [candidate division Zixibacteria bacterium]